MRGRQSPMTRTVASIARSPDFRGVRGAAWRGRASVSPCVTPPARRRCCRGRRSGAEIADASKLAGHTKVQTTATIYDRDVLGATRRVQRKRVASRGKADENV